MVKGWDDIRPLRYRSHQNCISCRTSRQYDRIHDFFVQGFELEARGVLLDVFNEVISHVIARYDKVPEPVMTCITGFL
jgi:hypothetical protein